MYWWADGVHFNVRLEQDRLACLVVVGVRAGGTKELVALADGYQEDTGTWLDLLRSLRDRGLADPNLAVGDGALGFWAAMREVFPNTVEQRCWVHKTANVLAVRPKRLQPAAKKQIQAIYNAETQADAINQNTPKPSETEPDSSTENNKTTPAQETPSPPKPQNPIHNF